MPRYIDADELKIDYGFTWDDITPTHDELYALIDRQPTVDVVERKKGKWISVTNGRGGHECSMCHNYAPSFKSGKENLSPYCPNCGAEMEE